MIQPLLIFDDWGLLILRVTLGLILIVYSWSKIKNIKATAEGFTGLGFKPGVFWGKVAAKVGFFSGLFLIAGFLTQFASVLIAIQFLVIIILKLKQSQKLVGGYELELLILASALALATLGAGNYALDEYLGIWMF